MKKHARFFAPYLFDPVCMGEWHLISMESRNKEGENTGRSRPLSEKCTIFGIAKKRGLLFLILGHHNAFDLQLEFFILVENG